jgi:hypothetical protein
MNKPEGATSFVDQLESRRKMKSDSAEEVLVLLD